MKKYFPALVFGAAVFIPVFFFSRPFLHGIPGFYGIAWPLFVAAVGAAILKTEKTSPWRTLLFVVIALGFIIRFKFEFLHRPDVPGEAPYCHIAMASMALNYFSRQYQAFASGGWGLRWPLSLGFLWLAVTLALGRGWCSWVCFYGGIDEGFSKILPRPPLKLGSLPRAVRHFPAILLILMILASVFYLTPVFCLWICPLKMTASFLNSNASIRTVQIALMLMIGILFLILGPILTGKRTFCALICPFGAWQSFFGRINPFRITINTSGCTGCGSCIASCPTFAIRRSKGRGVPEILNYCNMCGRCIQACPKGLIRYTVLGHDLAGSASGWASFWNARSLFVFSALVLAGTIGAIFVPNAVNDLLKLL